VKPESKLILLCGALWLVTKSVLMFLVPLETGIIAGTLLNLFFIMLIAVYTIHRRLRHKQSSNFIDDARAVMRSTVKYALLATVLFTVYMYGIAREITDAHQAGIEAEIHSHFATDEAFDLFIKENPRLEGIDRETALQESLDSFRLYASWYVQTTLSLLGLMVFATLAAVFTTLFWRNLFQ
jgi:hypothetical protein